MKNRRIVLEAISFGILMMLLTLSFTGVISDIKEIVIKNGVEKSIENLPHNLIGKKVEYNASLITFENYTQFDEFYSKKFLEVAEEVYNLHEDFNMSYNYDFDEIYNQFINIFDESYTSEKNEYIQTIQELKNRGYRGDCDCYAMFFYVIAKKQGLEVRYVIGINADSGHAWIQIKKDGKWIEYNSTSKIICDDYCISNRFGYVTYME